jgi:hypothetical protein
VPLINSLGEWYALLQEQRRSESLVTNAAEAH